MTVGKEVVKRVETGKRHTDEVYKVVACESHGKGECAEKHNQLEHVDAQKMDYLHEYC